MLNGMMGHGHNYFLILVELLEMEYPPVGKTLEVESPPPVSRRAFLPKIQTSQSSYSGDRSAFGSSYRNCHVYKMLFDTSSSALTDLPGLTLIPGTV